ncbi:MAG: glycosyltransferase family 39 protein [Kouleothrix sp.]|nr:glycosyltransferase family 39 protein [Kouleothrix sp.]
MDVTDRPQLAYAPRRRLAFDLTSSKLLTLQIVVILIVAAILRFNQIGQPLTDVFSWRQTSTAMMADNFFHRDWNIFFPEVNWNGPGPSYQGREFQTVSYLAALLYTVFGQYDWIGRTVAALFGLWSIFALYQLVRRAWDELHAIAAAAILALMPGAIFIDRSFLPDPAMVALVTTSVWMAVAYFQTEKLRYLVLASLIGSLGFLTKLPGLIVALPMAYAAFAILERGWLTQTRIPFILTLAAFCALAPVIYYYNWARELALTYPPYHFAGSGNWVWVDGFVKWWNQGYFVSRSMTNFYYWLWTGPIMGLAALGLLFRPAAARSNLAAAYNDPSSEKSDKAPWLFHWWLVGCVLFYIIGARELNENPWNFHLFNIPIAVLAGHGLVLLWLWGSQSSSARSALLRVGLVVLLLTGVCLNVLPTLYKPDHATQSYRMGLALREMTQPNDLVVTLANDIGDPVAIYYSQRRGWVFPPADIDRAWNELPEDDAEAIQLFDQLRAQGANWFGVVNERKKDFWVDHPELVDYIKRTCEFKVKTDDYVIYRIMTPDEVAKLPKK